MAGKMRMGMPSGLTSLLKDGYKHMSGLEEAILRNVEACRQLASITRTSLGPNAMKKLVVNHLEKLFVTSDAATIVQELEVQHPAARMLVQAAKMQEQEVGDGSNLVVTFAGELLGKAEELLRLGVHPSEIVDGYKKASLAAFAMLEELADKRVDNPRDRAQMLSVVRPVIASKQGGYEDLLAGLVVDAVLSVMPHEPRAPSVNVDNIRVAKLIGGTIGDSAIVKGVVVQREPEGTIRRAEKAKIAVFGCSIEASSPETRGTVVIKTADELMAYNKSEEALMEESIRGIAESGAKVVVAGGSISEIAMHYIEKYGMMAIKIMSKFELRRLCRAVNATAMVRVGPPTADELGFADLVAVQELSSRLVTVFRQDEEDAAVATIVLRGATTNALDDIERSIDDAVNTAKQACKDGRVVPGAGAIEMEMATRIQALGAATPGLEQYAINKFAEALEVVPRILAENAGQDPTDVISALYAAHAGAGAAPAAAAGGAGAAADAAAPAARSAGYAIGVDIDGDHPTKDAAAAGIWDSLPTKLSALRLASEAAITVLRVDTIIMSKQAGGPKPRAPGPADGGDD